MRRPVVLAVTLAVAGLLPAVAASAAPASAAPASAGPPSAAPAATPASGSNPGACRPAGIALAYSDALDKIRYGRAVVGGLSSLAHDPLTGRWLSAVDNHDDDPARIWPLTGLEDPTIAGPPIVLKAPDGTPYTGETADDEGLAVLPDGRYVVSSETEPAIRVFDRRGVQQSTLAVPSRFRVAPAGQATANATLEGLTLTPSGHRLIAAMEGTLSGDTGAGSFRRFLVYDENSAGRFVLTKLIGYRVQAGNRIPEVAAYGESSLLVEEAAFDPASGNTVSLYAVTGLDRAPDVTGVANLARAQGSLVAKTLVADVTRCPTLGAPTGETQANPLLDNYEGMAFTGESLAGYRGVTLVSDDNFSATQTTRLLDLGVRLP